MCSIVSSHCCLSVASLRSSTSPFLFRRVSPTFSMSVLNVLSKHLGGRPRLPLRLVLTVMVRAGCAGVSVGIWSQCQGGIVWIAVCLLRGVWTLSVCTVLHCLCISASGSLLGFEDVDDTRHTVSLSLLLVGPLTSQPEI